VACRKGGFPNLVHASNEIARTIVGHRLCDSLNFVVRVYGLLESGYGMILL
jgi:hypothetical protein